MKQWYALYVLLCSYAFVIWLDCFVGHFMSWWFLPRIWSSVTWHAALLFCFVPYWRLTPSKCVSIGIFFRGCVSEGVVSSYPVSFSQSLAPGPMYSPRQLPPHGRGWINLWLSILARTGGEVGLMLGSVVITELDAGLAGIDFHRYCTVDDVCHKQNT